MCNFKKITKYGYTEQQELPPEIQGLELQVHQYLKP